MDPFTIGTLLFSAGSLIAGYFRREARAELSGAVSRLRGAKQSARWGYEGAISAINKLRSRRLGSLGWLPARALREMAADQGRSSLSPSSDIFGKGSTEQLKKIIASAKVLMVSGRDSFDTAIAISSLAALGIKGLQYVDHAGIAHMPALHTTLHDAVSSFDVDHHGLADILGPIGDSPLVDILHGGLVIFSGVRLGNNIWKIYSTHQDISSTNEQVQEFEQIAVQMNSVKYETDQLHTRHEEVSYQVFKYTSIAAFADRMPGFLTPEERIKVKDSILKHTKDWWTAMQVPVKTPA